MNFVLYLLLPILYPDKLADAMMYFKPPKEAVPFMVYFKSQVAICMGALVSRQIVLTAAVCVLPGTGIRGLNMQVLSGPITVTVGSKYRHPRRGIKIQVTKILYPKALMYMDTATAAYRIETSLVFLLLKRKVSDLLTEVPVRSIYVDFTGETQLWPHSTCLTAGWHYFGPGDKIQEPGRKFRLYRNLRVQLMDVVRPKSNFCDTLTTKFALALQLAYRYTDEIDVDDMVCMRDPDRLSQPCHGMIGSPLICDGKLVGVYSMRLGQWENCTGHTILYQLVRSPHLAGFMDCVSKLFEPMMLVNMEKMHKKEDEKILLDRDYDPPETYDQISTRDPESDVDSDELGREDTPLVPDLELETPPIPEQK